MKTTVWGIYYKLKQCPKSGWAGPIGVYWLKDQFSIDTENFKHRPYFFRTRKLAREEIAKQSKCCFYKTEKFTLNWSRPE